MVRLPRPATKVTGNNQAKSTYVDCLRIDSPRRRTLLSLLPVNLFAGPPPAGVLVGVIVPPCLPWWRTTTTGVSESGRRARGPHSDGAVSPLRLGPAPTNHSIHPR